MHTIVVFGASGQLGQCLQKLAREQNLEQINFLSSQQANILDVDTLQKVFAEYKPAYCINCAAYTAVDKAEDEAEQAMKLNRDGVSNLSRLCREQDATLIHISTDFVFSGSHHLPLTESEDTLPINVYGESKLAGEKAVVALTQKHFIIRTSWLYSEYGNNFVKTMLRLGKEREQLKVIWDQVGSPTYAMDLATCILSIIKSKTSQYGLYHYSNEGVASWYDFAQAIFELSRMAVKVTPVRSAEYLTKARRPAYSVMDKSKIKRTLGIAIPYWKHSLQTCINRLYISTDDK
ncbi:dTDP-4-dehydrorhamnose reductase [Rhodocytophaga aerolata]|uniref:dTDP-4-dehydrorhamnose reductase n=1 Tax=Rhodocytophaga aerolata TaxID=455078 RepID=A0ABT8R6T8_9BACT|nr:dTDP-4-dehydrorhamnose reductase [Rhodocytophaga aerolata]MDO1447813.1 dTDP-4-dehydrorhamnose reductase [Rhodocytophaga aerolata]